MPAVSTSVRSSSLLRPAVALLLAASWGCNCDGDNTTGTDGELVPSPASVDFSYVIVGQQRELKVTLRNAGTARLRISAIERAEGTADVFRFSPRTLDINSQSSAEFSVFFQPRDEGEVVGKLLFSVNTVQETVELPLKGTGVRTALTITPSPIDFGRVVLEEEGRREVTVSNAASAPVDVRIEGFDGERAAAYAYELADGGDTLRLEPGGSGTLTAIFSPSTVGPHPGVLLLKPCSTCDSISVDVAGEGLAAGIIPEPDALDFGAVTPNTTRTLDLTLRNVGNNAIGVLGVRPAVAGTDFSVTAPPEWPVMQPGDTYVVKVNYAPAGLGPDAAQLVVSTDDPRAPGFSVPVKGYGGGPAALVTPAAVDFGTVALGYPVTRRIAIANTGLNDPSSDLDVLEVTAVRITASDLAVTAVGGLPLRIQPGARGFVELTYSPQSPGALADDLVLDTNDLEQRTVTVPVRGTALLAPDCLSYELVPSATPGLRFGVVQRGRAQRLALTIRNAQNQDCVLAKVDLDPAAPEAFALPNGAIYGKVLRRFETEVVEVEFSPPGSATSGTDYAGFLDVQVASSSNPSQRVELSGRGAEVCLSITPPGVDFGVVEPECQTNERTFTIYNACRTAVRVQSVSLGQGAGTFTIVPPPQTLPHLLQPASELRFAARFRPRTTGPHYGTVEIVTDQSLAGGRPYVVTLEGDAVVDAQMEETFAQADRARADILFVVDDSYSMEEEQETLSSEFDSFMRFAVGQGIDYNLAVTTTDVDSTTTAGKFRPIGGTNRIVTPRTPNPESAFAANVNVGLDGSGAEQGLEAAYLALSDPNINGANAGFLRPDAVLSVIVVSDEEDSSNRPVTFYVDFLRNVKGARGANLVTFSGIVGTGANGCTGPGGDADRGSRYIEAANRLNGITESICADDWGVGLQKLGLTAFGYKSRFLLTSDPSPSTIRVFLDPDGATGPEEEFEVEATSGFWSYTVGVNAIDFTPTAVPPAGSAIRVTYEVVCQ